MKAVESNRISVVGLGKLGAPLAACLAHKGFRVIGMDVDARKIKCIREGIPPVFEPGLEEVLHQVQDRLAVTDSYENAVQNSDVTFILVPTPSDAEGGFSLSNVLPACEAIGRALRDKSSFHVVVLTSTVLPGMTENDVKPALEAFSGKKCGVDFGLCYNPEFVSLGSVIKGLLHPDFILIGESDSFSGDLLASIYKKLCENAPPLARMNFVNAELTKLSVNTYVTTKIAFANMVARICEQLPGADVDVVTSALALDSRIGGKYLKGAIGYGGPCFPRDNSALALVGRRVGTEATLAEATDGANRREVRRLAHVVKSRLPKRGRVGILGLTYKPDTDVVEESQGLLLAQLLLAEGIAVSVYDPAGMKNAQSILSGPVALAGSIQECVRSADVVVVATPWDEFRSLSPQWLTGNGRRTLVDCWRILDAQRYTQDVDYLPLGIGTYEGPVKFGRGVDWKGVQVLVTGGASFIGSHLVDALLKRDAKVRVVDNLSSGRTENIKQHLEAGTIEFLKEDLAASGVLRRAMAGVDVAFHLAADHGGRGYVDLHQVECATNFTLDGSVFRTAYEMGVQKVVFASSGCVYPNHIQTNPDQKIYLTEDMVGPPYDADNMYGWAKLMGELTLQSYYKQFGMKSASCRYFTVYGPRGVENHAVIAMIARAFIRANPFEVWGTGEQVRNWTYIEDIVEGTILAAERIDDASAVNLGTMERIRVMDAAEEILRYTGHQARIVTRPDMPTGPLNRVAENGRAKTLLGWEPRVAFMEGLHRTIDWYYSTRDREEVSSLLGRLLIER